MPRTMFGKPLKPATSHWVESRLVAEVAYATWSRDGPMRQANLKGLREDKDPREVRRAG